MHIKTKEPSYVMLSSDYSQQEPSLLSAISGEQQMVDALIEGKDIYSTIASVAFNLPYEDCLEFVLDENGNKTDITNVEGKKRRTEAKSIVLGITYGRSTTTIGEQLFGTDHTMTDEDKTKKAQDIYDAVLREFPGLKAFMAYSQNKVKQVGYTETILGRRRHIPDMQLPRFEFKPMAGYTNDQIDLRDADTLDASNEIPQSDIDRYTKEFESCKYYGQIVKKTKELYKKKIKVVNNTKKITDATRQVVNCVDFKTEILTLDGWKTYDQVFTGQAIVAFDIDQWCYCVDRIQAVNISHEPDQLGFHMTSPIFDAVCTDNHRWLVEKDLEVSFQYADKLCNGSSNRIMLSGVDKNLTDPTGSKPLVDVMLFKLVQGTFTYDDIAALLQVPRGIVRFSDFVIATKFSDDDRKLIQSVDYEKAEMIQTILLLGGYCSRIQKLDDDKYTVEWFLEWSQDVNSSDFIMQRVSIPDGVWCPTTSTSTWVARRNGKCYITGNSIIQGSAADMTKMAILNLENNERWKEIGGRLLVPVHDELICEVPIQHYEEGRKILQDSMESAGEFLPFDVHCDVETTLRWYGLEYPCKYQKPSDIHNLNSLSEDEIKWIQYHLCECEYLLPIYPDKEGNAPEGDAARGINGEISEEMKTYIDSYIDYYNITEDDFIDHIETLVVEGVIR